MNPWKNNLVVLTIALLAIVLPAFLFTGYTALYQAWVRSDLQAALPLLPWARNFGMLAISGATVALGILFSPKTFPLPPKARLWLSLLAAATIGFFAEFRNEGKFHFKGLVQFFGPGTWIHDGLANVVPSIASFLYRIEYSHWNDFLMGPAIVSILFTLVFFKIYGAFQNQGPTSITSSSPGIETDLDHAMRFARTLMNVGLFWFFIQAWAEKAGYLRNRHSNDEIDLPFEFAGTMLGFWMARVLTKPFDERPEKFRSTFVLDFLSSGVIGLLYTLIVGPLTEGVASSVGHALYSTVPPSLDIHEYTPLQQHVRPFELLLLAAAMWWGLNHFCRNEGLTRLNPSLEEPEVADLEIEGAAPELRWNVLITMGWALALTTGYLLILATMLSFLEPQGWGWTLVTAAAGVGAMTAALLLVKRAAQRGFTTLISRSGTGSSS